MKNVFTQYKEGTLNTPPPTEAYPSKKMQKQPSKKSSGVFGWLDKFGDVSGKVLGGAGDLLFGSMAESAGGLITQGIASTSKLYGKYAKDEGAYEFGKRIESQVEAPSAVDIGFTVLELYPGGGYASRALKKFPGGEKIAEGLAKMSPKLRKTAAEDYIRALAPTKEKTKTLAKKVAPEMLERRIKFKSGEELAEKATAKAEEAGEQLSSFWDNLPEGVTIKMKPALKRLDDLANKYIVDGEVIKPEAVDAINKMKNTLSKLGDDVSAQSARKLRQILDEAKDFTKTSVDAVREKAERQAANAIREELARDLPDLAKINAEFNFWSDVKMIAEETSRRKAGQTKGLYRTLAGLTGFGVGASGEGEGISERLTEGFVVGMLGLKGMEYIKSPSFITTKSILKNQLADALAKGDIGKVNIVISKMIAGVKNIID